MADTASPARIPFVDDRVLDGGFAHVIGLGSAGGVHILEKSGQVAA